MEDNIAQQDKNILDNFTAMTVGQIFIKARAAQNLDVGQIAQHLNISTPHLEAIEQDDKDGLPPKVYAVGFVRAYADVLGLDSEKVAYLFKSQFYGVRKNDAQRQGSNNKNVIENKIDNISNNLGVWLVLLAVGSVVLLIVGTLIWLLWPRDHSENDLIPPAPTEAVNPLDNQPKFDPKAKSETISEPMDLIVKPSDGAKAYGGAPLTSPLVFKAVEKTWIEIMPVTGKDALLSRTLKAGDVFYTPADTDILLTTGNAGGIEVYLDGQKLGSLGKDAEIIRLRPFSVKALRLQLQQ